MPFKNKAQLKACFAKNDPDWDCHKWAHEGGDTKDLPDGPKPEKKSKKKKSFKEYAEYRDQEIEQKKAD